MERKETNRWRGKGPGGWKGNADRWSGKRETRTKETEKCRVNRQIDGDETDREMEWEETQIDREERDRQMERKERDEDQRDREMEWKETDG